MTATTIFTIPAGETFQSFAQLNNILIVITDLNRYFLLYDVDTGTYSELEEIPMPLMDFQENIKSTGIMTESNRILYIPYGGSLTKFEIYENHYDGYEVTKTNFEATLDKYKKNGEIRGFVLFRIAFKLFDGSYIKHSNIYFLDIANSPIKYNYTFSNPGTGDDIYIYFRFSEIEVGNIKFSYKFSNDEASILNKYKDVIKSMDIFMSNPIPNYFTENAWLYDEVDGLIGNPNITEVVVNDDGQIITIPTNQKNLENIIDQINYYKIESIDFQNILDNPVLSNLEEIEFVDLENILTFETLPVDNFTHHKVWGAKNYNYNSRLHFGNVTTKFFKGFYPFKWRYDYDINSAETYIAKVYIRTDQGEKIVYKEIETPAMDEIGIGQKPYLYFDNVISYPDSRAYKIEFLRVVSGGSNDGVYFGSTIPVSFDLKPHLFLNLSYYINPSGINTVDDIENHASGDYYLVTLNVADTDEENDLLNDPNRVQVSRLDNALVYEAVNSYQVGNDDETIIGFGSVVEPLSDGQFGQFPLYIFTTAGNFVLSQGSGAILYSNILPLNKDVCNNPLSITDIGGGVVYSTEKGLMILSGRQITEISQFLKGDPREYLINDTTYQDYLNDQNFVQLLSDLSTVNFLTYLSGAIIGFDYVNKEIIVSNDTYTFSYVYNLESKSWHKITEVYSEFVKVIPKTYGYSSGILYDLTDEDYDYIETLIQTRPIKLDTLNHKSIERLVLRGYYDVKDLTYSALLIYGSVDGKSYKFLIGRSRQDDSTFQDLLVKNTHSSFKYFILVFVGQLKDSSINFIEVSYSERFGNKLR